MKLMLGLRHCLTILLIGWFAPLANAFPDWVRAVSQVPTPENAGDASVVVLLEDTLVDVDAEGVATTTHRVAFRILGTPGKSWATASVYYNGETDKVRSASAWLIRNGKEVRPPSGTDWVDRTIDEGSLYTEMRQRTYRRHDVAEGDVFVAETRHTGPLLTAQLKYQWGWGAPVVEERLELRVPTGFSIASFWSGDSHPETVTSTEGRSTKWIVRNQPLIRSEPHAPQINLSWPVLCLNMRPPAGTGRFKPVIIDTWVDVGRWIDGLCASQCDTSPELAAAVQRATAGVVVPVEKARALAAYVQALRYVAVDQGLSRGLGYQPRKASRVLAQGYGDCKDKANLLRAMLRESGIESFTIAVRSGNDRPVREDYPSPGQFDHAIVGIRMEGACDLPALLQTEQWGQLLIFDPTDPHVTFGELPMHLQGTRGFIQVGGSTGLIELPVASPDNTCSFTRKLSLQLNAAGIFTGEAQIAGHGNAAADLRRELVLSSTDEALRKLAISLLGDSLKTAALSNVTHGDDKETREHRIEFSLRKAEHLQHMPNGLAVAKMDLLDRDYIPTLAAPKRHHPIKLLPLAFSDEIKITLADGLAAEELPATVSLSTPYGIYQREYSLDGRTLRLKRQLRIGRNLVPASEYAAVRKFLTDVAKADRSSILLRTRI